MAYESADKAEKMPLSIKFILALLVFLDMCRICILSVPIFFAWFIDLVFGRKLKDLKGEVALVTGGGNGLGRQLALRLANTGCDVAVVDLDFAAAKVVAHEITQLKIVTAKAYQADLSKLDEVKELRQKILSDFGRVDILINNAGVMPRVSIREGSAEDLQKVVDVNIMAHFWTIRSFLPGMLTRNHGHIVAISSMLGLQGMARAGVYSATKYALKGLMESLDAELRMENKENKIRTTTVFPYFIRTRKSLVDNVELRFPAISPKYAAHEIVKGIQQNLNSFSVPRFFMPAWIAVNNLPSEATQLWRSILPFSIKPDVLLPITDE